MAGRRSKSDMDGFDLFGRGADAQVDALNDMFGDCEDDDLLFDEDEESGLFPEDMMDMLPEEDLRLRRRLWRGAWMPWPRGSRFFPDPGLDLFDDLADLKTATSSSSTAGCRVGSVADDLKAVQRRLGETERIDKLADMFDDAPAARSTPSSSSRAPASSSGAAAGRQRPRPGGEAVRSALKSVGEGGPGGKGGAGKTARGGRMTAGGPSSSAGAAAAVSVAELEALLTTGSAPELPSSASASKAARGKPKGSVGTNARASAAPVSEADLLALLTTEEAAPQAAAGSDAVSEKAGVQAGVAAAPTRAAAETNAAKAQASVAAASVSEAEMLALLTTEAAPQAAAAAAARKDAAEKPRVQAHAASKPAFDTMVGTSADSRVSQAAPEAKAPAPKPAASAAAAETQASAASASEGEVLAASKPAAETKAPAPKAAAAVVTAKMQAGSSSSSANAKPKPAVATAATGGEIVHPPAVQAGTGDVPEATRMPLATEDSGAAVTRTPEPCAAAQAEEPAPSRPLAEAATPKAVSDPSKKAAAAKSGIGAEQPPEVHVATGGDVPEEVRRSPAAEDFGAATRKQEAAATVHHLKEPAPSKPSAAAAAAETSLEALSRFYASTTAKQTPRQVEETAEVAPARKTSEQSAREPLGEPEDSSATVVDAAAEPVLPKKRRREGAGRPSKADAAVVPVPEDITSHSALKGAVGSHMKGRRLSKIGFPRLAFEFFSLTRPAEDSLATLVAAWQALPAAERKDFDREELEDRERFRRRLGGLGELKEEEKASVDRQLVQRKIKATDVVHSGIPEEELRRWKDGVFLSREDFEAEFLKDGGTQNDFADVWTKASLKVEKRQWTDGHFYKKDDFRKHFIKSQGAMERFEELEMENAWSNAKVQYIALGRPRQKVEAPPAEPGVEQRRWTDGGFYAKDVFRERYTADLPAGEDLDEEALEAAWNKAAVRPQPASKTPRRRSSKASVAPPVAEGCARRKSADGSLYSKDEFREVHLKSLGEAPVDEEAFESAWNALEEAASAPPRERSRAATRATAAEKPLRKKGQDGKAYTKEEFREAYAKDKQADEVEEAAFEKAWGELEAVVKAVRARSRTPGRGAERRCWSDGQFYTKEVFREMYAKEQKDGLVDDTEFEFAWAAAAQDSERRKWVDGQFYAKDEFRQKYVGRLPDGSPFDETALEETWSQAELHSGTSKQQARRSSQKGKEEPAPGRGRSRTPARKKPECRRWSDGEAYSQEAFLAKAAESGLTQADASQRWLAAEPETRRRASKVPKAPEQQSLGFKRFCSERWTRLMKGREGEGDPAAQDDDAKDFETMRAAWEAMQLTEREPYHDAGSRGDAGSSSFRADFEDWFSKHPPLAEESAAKRRRRQAPAAEGGPQKQPRQSTRRSKPEERPEGAPALAVSAFGLFRREWVAKMPKVAQARDEENAGAEEGEARLTKAQFTQLRQEWLQLSSEEKERHSLAAESDRKRFDKEITAWRQENPDSSYGRPRQTRRGSQEAQKGGAKAQAAKAKRSARATARTARAKARQSSGRLGKKRKPKLPSGHPAAPASSYKRFCQNFMTQRRAAQQAAAGPAEEEGTPQAAVSPPAKEPDAAAMGEALVAVDPEAAGPAAGTGQQRGMGNVLKEMREAWTALPVDEREALEREADEDRQRYEKEVQAWRAANPEEAARLARESAAWRQAKGGKRKPGKRGGKRAKIARPPGFPEDVWSAYKFFCRDFSAKKHSPDALVAEEAKEEEAGETDKATRVRATFAQMREAWRELTEAERKAYQDRHLEDRERFTREFETWRSQQPDGALGEKSELAAYMGIDANKMIAITTREAKPDFEKGSLGFLLQGLEHKVSGEKQAQQSRTAALAGPEGEDGLAGMLPSGLEGEQPQPIGGAPGGPAAAYGVPGGGASVDDLLGDMAMVEAELDGEEDEDDYGGGMVAGGALVGSSDLFNMAPATMEAPQAWSGGMAAEKAPPRSSLGPQLMLDASGNIVVNQSSLSFNVEEQIAVDTSGPVVETMSRYQGAYKKTKAAFWTADETQLFYEALQLYGTDLFLVQTYFRNKSAAQIKTKFTKEAKKHPKKIKELLKSKRLPFTTDAFEKMHGKIDTSKHFVPPPSPLPGEQPEPDGGLPGGQQPEQGAAEDDLFSQDPSFMEQEYSQEDENLTTNRLMALFD
eukprot:TRINITY_DN100435_c0_g1_i1.p1 TRINITY_DN100435_c0_g1~~TRINITY_DN100435_c0_g1_i1.p1  ORF type:complete len:2169 (+),score=644.04 TRINITY_DN100435_c0_g1_i1:107-6613(+)